MFYEGDILSGIVAANEAKKAVLPPDFFTFLTSSLLDDGEESLEWENTVLKDEEVARQLDSTAVVLRIKVGSQEAQYLGAYFPISEAPHLLVIKDGNVQIDLGRRHSLSETKPLLLQALHRAQEGMPTENQLLGSQAQLQREPDTDTGNTPPSSSNHDDIPPESNSPMRNTQDQSERTSSPVDQLLRERRQRLEAERKTQEAAVKAERAAKAKARREAEEAETAGLPPDSKRAKEIQYAQQQKRREQVAKLERERVLRLVENDKIERREREERRKELARAQMPKKAEDKTSDTTESAVVKEGDVQSGRPRVCAIQVRLTDGSTIRSRFGLDMTLGKEVRAWIDSQRSDDNTPYIFKQILSPTSNRTISISEEGETLQELGLVPSATLALFPVREFTNAYDRGGGGSLVSRGVSGAYGLVSSGMGLVTGAVGSLLTFGNPSTPPGDPTNTSNASSADLETHMPAQPPSAQSRVRVRTLYDQDESRKRQQFYNGNQLNFEPNPDEDETG